MTLPGPLRALLALALLWAASLAPGTMPARAADGGLVLEFCDGTGVVAMTRDAAGRWVPVGEGKAPDRHAPPCAFAAAHVAAAAPGSLAVAPVPVALLGALAWAGPAAPAPRPAAWKHPLPRGPPAA